MNGISPAEAAHRAASDAEPVLWVDEQDRPLGVLPRAELRERRLIGRATFIFLFNGRGELCVHQRTHSKALYPGYWDLAAGGMVGPDEDSLTAAERELGEELGVIGLPLQALGQMFFEGAENRLWCHVYQTQGDQPLRLQAEEVLQARYLDLAAVQALIDSQPVCPDSLAAWRCCRPAPIC